MHHPQWVRNTHSNSSDFRKTFIDIITAIYTYIIQVNSEIE